MNDTELQLEVASELRTKYFSELEAARRYLGMCHAILDDAKVEPGLLHERLLGLVEQRLGITVHMPPDWRTDDPA